MIRSPSLRARIRNGSLVLVGLVALLGLSAVARVYSLGGTIRATLYRNYVSIEAAQHMHAALNRLELAEHDGRAHETLPDSEREFLKWMNVEDQDLSEVGKQQLAGDLETDAQRLFADLKSSGPGVRHDVQFDALRQRIEDLIAMNRAAKFRANGNTVTLGRRIAIEFAPVLVTLLLVGIGGSWVLGSLMSKPLSEFGYRLIAVSHRRPNRVENQDIAELDQIARAFNHMAEQLERYEKVNVERLLYEKKKTEAIIESVEDGIVLLAMDGTITHINEVAAIIIGVEQHDVLGSAFDDLNSNHPHYMQIRDAVRKLVKTAGLERIEVQLHVRGRDHSYLLKPVALRVSDESPFGTLLILQDVTYLRDQSRARTNLLATLSHELRTPLTSILVSADLLNRGSLDENQRELVSAVLDESARMQQLADNLLSLARGELASIALRRERFDFLRLVEQTAARFRLQAEQKGVRLEWNVGPTAEINADATKLSWIMSNLIGNALRYTPEGGSITVLTAANGEDGLRFQVSDSGAGIPLEVQPYIFERFSQYPNGSGKSGAAGLGLAIVKEIVEAHGGRIFLESALGCGSTFTVDLPLADAAQGEAALRGASNNAIAVGVAPSAG